MKNRLRKIISILLVSVLLLTAMGGAAAQETPDMQDVFPEDWFYPYVTRSFHFGLTKGTSENGFRFEPLRNVTRAEFVTMLGRLHEYFEDNTIDTPADGTFYGRYLAWAVEHGVVRGDQNGDLMPHVLITREEMAVIVYRYIDVFELQGRFGNFPPTNPAPTDYQEISSWAHHEVVQMMYRFRLMQGTGSWPGVFSPQENSSRAEALAVLVRLGNVLYDAARFVLTISVEETTLPQGEAFTVNVELKNSSGEDYEITHDFLFLPHISGRCMVSSWDGTLPPPPEYQSRFFETDSVIRNIRFWGDREVEAWRIGANLELDTHELRFNATFYLNWGQENQRRVEVWSNPIMLTVQPTTVLPPFPMFVPGVVEIHLNESYAGRSLADLLDDFFDEFDVVLISERAWPRRNVDRNNTSRIEEIFHISLLPETHEIVTEAIGALLQNPYVRHAMPIYINIPPLSDNR